MKRGFPVHPPYLHFVASIGGSRRIRVDGPRQGVRMKVQARRGRSEGRGDG
jgi:hypothetical protein